MQPLSPKSFSNSYNKETGKRVPQNEIGNQKSWFSMSSTDAEINTRVQKIREQLELIENRNDTDGNEGNRIK